MYIRTDRQLLCGPPACTAFHPSVHPSVRPSVCLFVHHSFRCEVQELTESSKQVQETIKFENIRNRVQQLVRILIIGPLHAMVIVAESLITTRFKGPSTLLTVDTLVCYVAILAYWQCNLTALLQRIFYCSEIRNIVLLMITYNASTVSVKSVTLKRGNRP